MLLVGLLAFESHSQDNRDRDAYGGGFNDPFSDAQSRYAPPGQRPPSNFRLGIYSRNTPTGVVVSSVTPGSIAQQSGIEPNDTILTVNGYQVGIVNGRTYDISEELARRIDGQGRATLLIQNRRNGQLLNIPVQFFGGGGGGFSGGSSGGGGGFGPGVGQILIGTANTGNRNLVTPGMVLSVRLIDVSYPQWQNVAIAETQVPYTGRWPMAFQLNLNPNSIRPDHRYAVDAAITQQGYPVLETPSSQPVNLDSGNGRVSLTLIPSRNQNTNPGLPNSGKPIDQVAAWYQQLLGRNLNEREQAVWQRELGKGKSLDDILATILCSSEYFDQSRGNVDRYITDVYQVIFNRNPTPQEVQSLRNQMSQSATSRYPVVQSLMRQRNR
jgi:uncharacterized lipoprotein YbaY